MSKFTLEIKKQSTLNNGYYWYIVEWGTLKRLSERFDTYVELVQPLGIPLGIRVVRASDDKIIKEFHN